MASQESVTTWIEQIKDGDSAAAQQIWQRYVAELVTKAQGALRRFPRRVADEEDVVAVAFEKFFRYAASGRFPKLDDRHDLWQILVMLIEQTAVDQIRTHSAQKRGALKIRGESAFIRGSNNDGEADGINAFPGPEPSPELAATAIDLLEHLLQALGTEELCQIALLKLEGGTPQEIATELAISLRSVERKLRLIRQIWTRESSS